MRMLRAVVVASLVCVAPPGFAEDSQEDQVAHLVGHDAAAGRAYVGPTALTEAEGELTFNLRQLFAPFGTMGFAYGATDRVEAAIGLSWTDDLRDYERGIAPSASVKIEALRFDEGAIAIQAGVVHAPGDQGVVGGGFAPYANVIGSVCASGRGCALLVSAYVGALRTPNGSFGHEYIPVYGGGSILFGNDSIKGLLEVDTAADPQAPQRDVFGFGGVRCLWQHVALDVGVVWLSSPASSSVERTLAVGLSFK
jgi:hypothetical protein